MPNDPAPSAAVDRWRRNRHTSSDVDQAFDALAEIAAVREERDRLGEALEKEKARTCRDCGRQLGDPELQTCSACTRTRLDELKRSV